MFSRLEMKRRTVSQERAKNIAKANTYFKVNETPWLITSKLRDFAMV